MIYADYIYSNNLISKDLQRLINQIWKLLPMRENEEDWQKQLDSVIIEMRGLHIMFGEQLDFLIILSKLNGLYETKNFMSYRTIIFSIISTLTEWVNILNVK